MSTASLTLEEEPLQPFKVVQANSSKSITSIYREGRWDDDEHALFLRLTKIYRKNWKMMASIIKTRTAVQTRTHAQKFFGKLSPKPPHNYHNKPQKRTCDVALKGKEIEEIVSKRRTLFFPLQSTTTPVVDQKTLFENVQPCDDYLPILDQSLQHPYPAYYSYNNTQNYYQTIEQSYKYYHHDNPQFLKSPLIPSSSSSSFACSSSICNSNNFMPTSYPLNEHVYININNEHTNNVFMNEFICRKDRINSSSTSSSSSRSGSFDSISSSSSSATDLSSVTDNESVQSVTDNDNINSMNSSTNYDCFQYETYNYNIPSPVSINTDTNTNTTTTNPLFTEFNNFEVDPNEKFRTQYEENIKITNDSATESSTSIDMSQTDPKKIQLGHRLSPPSHVIEARDSSFLDDINFNIFQEENEWTTLFPPDEATCTSSSSCTTSGTGSGNSNSNSNNGNDVDDDDEFFDRLLFYK